MAEGFDQARDAFAAELGEPKGAPARDTGGRFTAKPETMFALRQVEGESAGDTREDQRLAEIERRVADGRSQEGDEAALEREGRRLSDAARAGAPGRDEGHGRAPPQQGVDSGGEPEHADEGAERPLDAEGEGGEGDADGAPVSDAEAAKWKVTYDGEPVENLEVMVDGSPVQVTLGEAVRGYMRNETFHRRLNQIDLHRQAAEQEVAQTGQVRAQYIAQCEYLSHMIGELVPPQPDWDKEFAADPRAAHEKQKAYQAVLGKMQWLNEQAQRGQAEAKAEYDRNSQKYAVDQFSKFVSERQIPDEKTLQSKLTRMRNYAQKMGFTEGEVATIYDSRMLSVLYEAAEADAGRTALPKAVIPGRGKTLRPGVATPLGTGTRKSIDEAQTKLARTGRLEDAAAVMSRLIR